MDAIFNIEANNTFQMALEEMFKQNHAAQCLNKEIASNVIELAKEDLRNLLIRADFDTEKVSEQILSSNWNQDRAEQFVSLLKERKSELFQSIITHHNSGYGDTVMDFMWTVKLVLGTSESKVIRYPLTQMVLSTVNSNGQSKQKLYEMNKEALLLLINNLETGLDGTL
ncbi:hypothetical protein ABMA27_001980 [Loxostege sticticalis]|uniref:COMM domain-containing protein n=1 Tax=Loxostege sticticalis TaxID=481309 RepID=A0ABR3HW63_LOXSC